MDMGSLRIDKRNDAYEQYYRLKYERMCEKQAEKLYDNYLKRVKNEFDQKSRNMMMNSKS